MILTLGSLDVLPRELVIYIVQFAYATFSGRLVTLTGKDVVGNENGSLANATCNYPMGVCSVDHRVFFTDYHNHNVRHMDLKQGTVETIAGSTAGATAGFKNGTGEESAFNSPIGITCNRQGDLFIADYFNNQVRKMWQNEKGKWYTETFAGSSNGNAISESSLTNGTQFNGPYGLCVDESDGTLILTDCQNHRILRLSSKLHGGKESVEVICGFSRTPGRGDGDIKSATLNTPVCCCFDPQGCLLVTDFYNHCVRKIDLRAGEVTTLAGNGTAGHADGLASEAQFNNPVGICMNGQNIFVADYGNHLVRCISPSGVVSTVAGKLNCNGSVDGLKDVSQIAGPIGIWSQRIGVVLVTDGGGHRVRALYV